MTPKSVQATFKRPRNPGPPQAHVDRMVALLFAAGGRWMTSAEIAKETGFNDRHIRDLAEHSECRIVSGPGCPGYRHILHTTTEQISEIVNRLQSQAKRMIARSIKINKTAHEILR